MTAGTVAVLAITAMFGVPITVVLHLRARDINDREAMRVPHVRRLTKETR